MKTVRLQTGRRNSQAARQYDKEKKESIGAASLQEIRKGAVDATLLRQHDIECHSPAAAEEHDEKKRHNSDQKKENALKRRTYVLMLKTFILIKEDKREEEESIGGQHGRTGSTNKTREE